VLNKTEGSIASPILIFIFCFTVLRIYLNIENNLEINILTMLGIGTAIICLGLILINNDKIVISQDTIFIPFYYPIYYSINTSEANEMVFNSNSLEIDFNKLEYGGGGIENISRTRDKNYYNKLKILNLSEDEIQKIKSAISQMNDIS
jgi:hypothetical protein